MRALIASDDGQLRRLDDSIAAFKARPSAEQRRMGVLLEALERERAAVLSFSGRSARARSALLSGCPRNPGSPPAMIVGLT
jgi:hypothetical protein